MKKLVLLLALIMCGCELNGIEQPEKPEKPTEMELQFQIGDVVDLKIGGQGQITNIVGSKRPYLIRIRTDASIEKLWFDEFELEIK